MAVKDPVDSLRQASGLLERGELAESALVLARVAHEFPDNPDVLFLHGVALHRLGQLDESLAKLSECLRLVPSHLQAANARAAVLSGLGRDQEAHDA